MATKSKAKNKTKSKPVAKKKTAPAKKLAKPLKVKSAAKAKVAPKGAGAPRAKAVAKATVAQKLKAKPTSTSAAKQTTLRQLNADTLAPLDDRIVVRIAVAEEKTAGGLFIPGSAATQPDRGEVMAKGPGHRNKKGRLRPLDVEVGDTVLFPQYTGTKISIAGEDFLIMREEDVLGVVET